LVSYGKYNRDNGAIFFDLAGGFTIPAGIGYSFIIAYGMGTAGSVDDTYSFDLITIMANGIKSGETAVINGLPISSSVKTISKAAPTTTTTAPGETTITTTTITAPTDECQTDEDCPGLSCSGKKLTRHRCDYDTPSGFNECNSTIESVECCGDSDCSEGYKCSGYSCIKKSGGLFGWLGGGEKKEGDKKVDYTWTIISIVVVIALVIALLLVIKNRKKRAWKSKKTYERDWESLQKKWK